MNISFFLIFLGIHRNVLCVVFLDSNKKRELSIFWQICCPKTSILVDVAHLDVISNSLLVSPTIMMSVGEHSNDTLSKLQSVQKTVLPIAQITQNCWVSGVTAISFSYWKHVLNIVGDCYFFFLLKTCFEYSRLGWQVSAFHWTAILNACHNTHNTQKKKKQCLNQRIGMWNHLTPWNLKTSPWRKNTQRFFLTIFWASRILFSRCI